jgi:hypothetical protein
MKCGSFLVRVLPLYKVLRPLENDRRQLTGDTYIRGMMHSEVVNMGLNVEKIMLV